MDTVTGYELIGWAYALFGTATFLGIIIWREDLFDGSETGLQFAAGCVIGLIWPYLWYRIAAAVWGAFVPPKR